MVRSTWVFLSLFATLPLVAADWQEIKQDKLAERPAFRAITTADKALVVDCTKGESVQAAVDKNASPVVIEIHGVCVEAVLIDAKDVTLRGLSSATDGLQSPTSTAAAVRIVDSGHSRLEKLSLSNSPGRAVAIVRSTVTMDGCRIDGNNSAPLTQGAVNLSESFLDAYAITATGNVRRVFVIATNSNFFCHGCEFTNNGGFAAVSTRGSLLSLLNSTVSQLEGIQSTIDAYADIDCVSEVSTHPCSMQATRHAAYVELGGTVALYGAGDFTGRVEAHDRGGIQLYGARQIAGATVGDPRNFIDTFGTLQVFQSDFADPPVQSRLLATDISGFARVLVLDASNLDGNIACHDAGDAHIDPGVVRGVGTAVTGCEHAP